MSNRQSAKRLLQNLKTYKLACNDVDPIEVESYRQLYGNDEGRVLGALMTVRNTDQLTSDKSSSPPPTSLKRKRRRRRNKHKQQKKRTKQEAVQQASFCPSDSPCSSSSLPQALNKLVEYSSDSSNGYTDSTTRFELPSFLRETPSNPKPPPTPPPVVHHTLDSDSDSMGHYFAAPDSGGTSSDDDDDDECTVQLATTTQHGVPSGLQLSSHVCYKCGKIGHMSNDCLVSHDRRSPQSHTHPHQPHGVRVLVSKCRKLKNDKNASCTMCGVHSNLANCLDCGLNICDGRGHLIKHLLDHPSHVTLFSYKLKKIVKCCKPNCGVVNCYQLLMCSSCFSKIFSQHYSMITATWSMTGLKAISNLLCCDDHFQWHRMNCPTSSNEFLVSEEKLKSIDDGTLSDFVF